MRTSYVYPVLCLVAAAAPTLAGQAPEEYLQDVEKRFAHALLPTALRPPITNEQADAFVVAIKHFRESSKAELPRIEAVNPGDDRRLKSDKQRLANWVGNEVPRQLNEVLQQTRQMLQGVAWSKTDFVKFGAEIDMADQDKVRNNLANPDNVALREDAIRDGRRVIELLVRIDEQLGEKSEWPAKLKEFEALAAKFQEKLSAAAAMIMPPKDIGDAKLKEIAEATLKTPDSGVKEWKRLIVNSAKQQKQFSVYELRGNTVVRCDYDFEHFQATTIEAEGNDLFLYHNTLAFYKSGAPTTPLNKWVIRERFRGAKIAAENVGK